MRVSDVEPARILRLADCATRLGCALRTARWLEVGARLYDRGLEPPAAEILRLIDDLPEDPTLDEAVAAVRRAAGLSSKRSNRHAS